MMPARIVVGNRAGGRIARQVGAARGKPGGPAGAVCFLASNFFLSITWPTVLGIAIRDLGHVMKLGTALICMGGAVGGVAYQLLNVIWKFPSVHLAMAIPAVSYAFVLAYAVVSARARMTAGATPGLSNCAPTG